MPDMQFIEPDYDDEVIDNLDDLGPTPADDDLGDWTGADDDTSEED